MKKGNSRHNVKGNTAGGRKAKGTPAPRGAEASTPAASTVRKLALEVKFSGSYRHHTGVPVGLLDDTLLRDKTGRPAILPGVVAWAMRDAAFAWAYAVVEGKRDSPEARLLATRIYSLLGGGGVSRRMSFRALHSDAGTTHKTGAESSTAIDTVTGAAKARTLRTEETGAAATFRSSSFDVSLDALDEIILNAAATYVRHIGKDKSRGYGRVETVCWKGLPTGGVPEHPDVRAKLQEVLGAAAAVAPGRDPLRVDERAARGGAVAELTLDIMCREPVLVLAGTFGIYHESRDYIPGRLYAGALLPLLAGVPQAHAWYRDGTLQFRNAYPLVKGSDGQVARGVPVPPFCVPKSWDGSPQVVGFTPSPAAPKTCRSGFVAKLGTAEKNDVGLFLVETSKTERVTGGNGVVIVREAIDQGTTLRALIRGPKEVIDALKQRLAKPLLVYLGAAKRGALGLCRVSIGTEAKTVGGALQGAAKVDLCLDSLAVVRGTGGGFSNDPNDLVSHLADRLRVAGVDVGPNTLVLGETWLARCSRDDAFVVRAQTMRPTLIGVAAGSVLRLSVASSAVKELQQIVADGVGEFRGEGFGEARLESCDALSGLTVAHGEVSTSIPKADKLPALPPIELHHDLQLPEPRWVRRTTIECTFEVSEPLHVGHGGDTSNELTLRRAVDGNPEIPGSGLKGALKRVCEQLSSTDAQDELKLVHARRQLFPPSAVAGENGQQSCLSVDWCGWVQKPRTYERPGIAVARKTGSVVNGAYFKREMYARGNRFRVSLTLHVPFADRDAAVEQVLTALLDVVHNDGLDLGGAGGRVKLANWSVSELDFSPSRVSAPWAERYSKQAQHPMLRDGRRTFQIDWTPQIWCVQSKWTSAGGVLVGAENAQNDNELRAYREAVLNSEGKREQMLCIPRSTWKGPFRARAEFLARTSSHPKEAMQAVDLLFGPWRILESTNPSADAGAANTPPSTDTGDPELHRGALVFQDSVLSDIAANMNPQRPILALSDHLGGPQPTALAKREGGVKSGSLTARLDMKRLDELAQRLSSNQDPNPSEGAAASKPGQRALALALFQRLFAIPDNKAPEGISSSATLGRYTPPLVVGRGGSRGAGHVQLEVPTVMKLHETWAKGPTAGADLPPARDERDPAQQNVLHPKHERADAGEHVVATVAEAPVPVDLLSSWTHLTQGDKVWGAYLRGASTIRLVTDPARIAHELATCGHDAFEVHLFSDTHELTWVRGHEALWLTSESPAEGEAGGHPHQRRDEAPEPRPGVPSHGVRSYYAPDDHGNMLLTASRLVPPPTSQAECQPGSAWSTCRLMMKRVPPTQVARAPSTSALGPPSGLDVEERTPPTQREIVEPPPDPIRSPYRGVRTAGALAVVVLLVWLVIELASR